MLLKICNWILNFGVSEEHPMENELIRLYNGMSLLSSIGTFLILLSAWLSGFSTTYIYIVSFILIVYMSVIGLNYFEKILLSRYVVSIGSPIWVNSAYLLIGGNFCQGVVTICSMAITYVAFQKMPKVRWTLFAFQLGFYFLVSTYVNAYSPIWGVIDFPYDEIVVFVGGLGWATILLYKFNKDQSKLLEDLKNNNQELINTTKELERFTYIASHDLKSPLRTINSFIGLIERDVKRENYLNIRENLDFVKTGAKQMHFLVEDILELSKLKKHEKEERSLIDLNLILEKARHNLKQEIEEQDAIIYCEKLPAFLGHEVEFLLLFQNFLQNGIKYNENKQPTVIITAEKSNHELKISFKDNGIGIEEKYHEQIFQFFKRLHNSSKYKGTGLGLGLCKKIIDNYDGQVELV